MPPLVAFLVFDDLEVLDFAGPYEVFAAAAELHLPAPWTVATVALRPGPVRAVHGLRLLADHVLPDAPAPDLLVVPGGFGTRALVQDPAALDLVGRYTQSAREVLTVCTGSIVLGAAGLLDGMEATTHHSAFDRLRAAAPQTRVAEGARFVDNGRIVTAAGISAGIDAALHLVARRLGSEAAARTARYLEYEQGRAP